MTKAELLDLIVKRRAEGKTIRAIAEEAKCSQPWVWKMMKEAGLLTKAPCKPSGVC